MKKYLFTLLAGLIGFISSGQTQSIIGNDIAQGEKLLEAYFTPMAESFGAGLNNGWYNTAKPHSFGGFDITFSANIVIIPSAAKTFKIGNAFGGVFTSNENEGQTILGVGSTGSNGTIMEYNNSTTNSSTQFTMPSSAIMIRAIPIQTIQAGIGLIKKTAVDVRYAPRLEYGEKTSIDIFGIGVKHDLLQWIPVAGDAIPMSLSLQAGYTSVNAELEIYEQNISLNTKATTINLVASKRLLMVTGYAGIGYNSATTTFASNANFKLQGVQFDEKVEMKFESNKNVRANIGLRLNITLVTIHADYTFSEYPTATLGLGVSFR